MDEQPNNGVKHFQDLTAREAEILALLAEGLSDREIAERLTVAYTTVKWYNRQIFNKLGVEKRRQAINRAKALGLLSVPQPVNPTKSSLPTAATSLVGRTREIQHIRHMLMQPEVRLLTLVGTAGIGK